MPSKKKTVFYYKKKELEEFVNKTFDQNNINCKPIVDYFGIEDEKIFFKKYKAIKPNIVLTQSVHHKYPKWIPPVKNSKVIYFPWGADGLNNIIKSSYKNNVVLNVLRHKEDKEIFSKINIPSKYFGNVWIEQVENYKTSHFFNFKNKKICFISESWIAGLDTNNNLIKWNKTNSYLIDKVLKILKSEGYFVVIKKREKGYPTDKENGFTNYIKEKPDLFIEKDLYFPSSLFSIPVMSDICIFLGHNTQGTMSLINTYNFFGKKVLNFNIEDLKTNFKKIKNEILNFKKNKIEYKQYKKKPSKLLVEYIDEYIR